MELGVYLLSHLAPAVQVRMGEVEEAAVAVAVEGVEEKEVVVVVVEEEEVRVEEGEEAEEEEVEGEGEVVIKVREGIRMLLGQGDMIRKCREWVLYKARIMKRRE
jgi:hypothetical protein